MELDLQRHRDMLREVLSRILTVTDGVNDLRAQVAREQAPAAADASVAAIPLTSSS